MPVENLVGEENKGWTYAKYLPQESSSAGGPGASGRAFARRSVSLQNLVEDAARRMASRLSARAGMT